MKSKKWFGSASGRSGIRARAGAGFKGEAPRAALMRAIAEPLEERRLLSGLAPGIDLTQFGTDVQQALGSAQAQLDPLLNHPLPIVGDKLSQAVQTVETIANEFGNELQSVLSQFNQAQMDPVGAFEKLLASNLGQGGSIASIFNFASSQFPSADELPPVLNGSGLIDHVEFALPINYTVPLVSSSINFSAGLPGLGLNTNGGTVGIAVGITGTLDVGFDSSLSAGGGFFINTSATKLQVGANLSLMGANNQPASLMGTLGFLQLTATDHRTNDGFDGTSGDPYGPTGFNATFNVNFQSQNGAPTDLPIGDLSDLGITASLSGAAAVDLDMTLGFGAGAEFPSLQALFHLGWSFDTSNGDGTPVDAGGSVANFGSTPMVGFENVSLSLGSFFSNYITPIANDIKSVLEPLNPVLKFLNTPVPILGDHGPIQGFFFPGFNGTVTVAKVAELLDPGSTVAEFVQFLNTVDNLVSNIPTGLGNTMLPLGSLNLDGTNQNGQSFNQVDPRNLSGGSLSDLSLSDVAASPASLSQIENSVPQVTSFLDDIASGTGVSAGNLGDDAGDDLGGGGSVGNNGKLDFPILDDPMSAFGLLLGKPVNLFTFTVPTLSVSVPFSLTIPIVGPIGIEIAGDASGGAADSIFTASANLSGGYDTSGLTEWLANGNINDLADGLYFDSGPASSITLSMGLSVGAGLDLPLLAALDVYGGISGTLTVSLNNLNGSGQQGEDHWNQIVTAAQSNFSSLFTFSGVISANFGLEAQVLPPLGPSWNYTIASIALYSFDSAVETGSAPPPSYDTQLSVNAATPFPEVNTPTQYTATVASQGGIPSGYVAFEFLNPTNSAYDGYETVPLVNGVATAAETFQQTGDYTVTAQYLGGENAESVAFNGSAVTTLGVPVHGTIYVDQSYEGSVDLPVTGTSWQFPYRSLAQALDAATPGSTVEVAAGDYSPVQDGITNETSFNIYQVAVVGGYKPGGSASPNPNLYVTTLDGSGTPGSAVVSIDDTYPVVGDQIQSVPVLADCTISGGSDSTSGGGAYIAGGAQVENCIFTNDTAPEGGAISINGVGTTTSIVDCLFTDNRATDGSAIAVYPLRNGLIAKPGIANCTFVGNTASNGGGTMYDYNGNARPTITNSILWGNTGGEIGGAGASGAQLSYSDVDQAGYAGSNHDIDANPNFVGTGANPYELQFPSYCINTGLNSPVEGDPNDLAGKARIVPATGAVDMGAFEYQGPDFTLYVDHTAHGQSTGSSWANAFTTLQGALAIAGAGDTIDIAQGVYTPGTLASSTFTLASGVTVQGGFASGGAIGPSPQTYVTYLDGSLSGGIRASNVVSATATGSGTVLDGLTIENGSASNADIASGGGLLVVGGSGLRIIDCTFSGNASADTGGAIAIFDSSPTIVDCLFTGNSAGFGGAISIQGSSPLLADCAFYGNTAHYGGGAIANDSSSSPKISNCSFTDNTATQGGAIYSDPTSTPTVNNSILWNDISTDVPADAEIYGPATVTYSDVSGGAMGTGILDSNPLFNSSSELELQDGSPAIGAADAQDAKDTDASTGSSTDLAGDDRLTVFALPGSPPKSSVDMGAYQYQGPTSLIFAVSPPITVAAGYIFANAVYVNLEQNGRLVSNDNSTVTLSIASGPAGAVLGGTVTSLVIGHQAQFTDLFISGPAGTYTLEATDGGDIPATSQSFTVTTPQASIPSLAFIQGPINTLVNTALTPDVSVGVFLNDSLDTAAPHSSVSLSLNGAVIASAQVDHGVAQFIDLSFASAGTYTLTATDGNYASADSNSFTISITVIPPSLEFGTVPLDSTQYGFLSPAITVFQTENGQPLADGSTVTLTVVSAPAGGALDMAPLQATVDANGVATFAGLEPNEPGTYVVKCSDENDNSTDEITFNVTPDNTYRLVFSEQPSSYQLAQNTPVPTFDVSVQAGSIYVAGSDAGDEISIQAFGAGFNSYGGALQAYINNDDVAYFSSVYLGKAGISYLEATDLTEPGIVEPGYSNSFDVAPAAASQLSQARQPGFGASPVIPDGTAGSSFTIPVTAVDFEYDLATSYSGNYTFTLVSAPAGVPLGTTYNSSFQNGVGAIPDVVQDIAGSYTLQSSDSSLAEGDVYFTITADVASEVKFRNVPSVTSTGVPIAPAIQVEVDDQYGNLVTSDTSPVTLSLVSPAGAVLEGLVTVDAVDGVATFDQVYTDQTGGVTLMAQDQNDGIASSISTALTVMTPATIYVDQNAQGTDTGQDWADAYTTLQPALAAAIAGDTIDIAQGDYSPGSDPTDTFQLLDGVTIQGGFPAGGGSTSDPDAYPTLFDGTGTNYNVVTASGTDSSAVLEDVTITGGNAAGDGTGYDDSYSGGGLLADGGSATITDCTFTANSAAAGGAIYAANQISPMTITDCIFTHNVGTASAGAIYTNGALLTVLNCQFIGNSATGSTGGANPGAGGAVVDDGDSTTWVDCLFTANIAEYYGGAMHIIDASPSISNCTFSANQVTSSYYGSAGGGAMDNEADSAPTVTNCIFWNDNAYSDSAVVQNEITNDAADPNNPTSSAVVTYSDVEGGYSGNNNIDGDPFFVDAADGDYQLLPTSPCINAGDNNAPGLGTLDLAGNPRIVDGVVDIGAYEAQSANVYWTGGDDGLIWNDPGNWSDDAVPTQADSVTIGSGFLNIQVPSGFYSVNTLTAASPIEITGGGTLVINSFSDFSNGLTIDGGGRLVNAITTYSSDPGPIVIYDLTIISGGSLDLGSGAMVVQGGDLSAITAEIASGYNGGAWTGTGITSSAAAADSTHLTALGAIVNDDGNGNPLYGTGTTLGLFDGYSPADGDVLVRYTYYGDANLDGKVDASDYSLIDNSYLNHLTGWYNGDLNYDGVVNGSDYTLIDNAFNMQGASLAGQISSPAATSATEIVSSTASNGALSGKRALGSDQSSLGGRTNERSKAAVFSPSVFSTTTPITLAEATEQSIEQVLQKKDLLDVLSPA